MRRGFKPYNKRKIFKRKKEVRDSFLAQVMQSLISL